MINEASYSQLKDRISKADQRRAVLLSREEDKKAERDRLVAELKANGIDTERPEAEIVRLEAEIKADFDKALAAVEGFEKALEEVGKLPQSEVIDSTELDMN